MALPLSAERLADHSRDKNKEQRPSIDCRGDSKHRPPILKQSTACASTQLPRWLPKGRKGSETPPGESWPAYKSPSLLFDQDLVVNFVTYTRVYMVSMWVASFQLHDNAVNIATKPYFCHYFESRWLKLELMFCFSSLGHGLWCRNF